MKRLMVLIGAVVVVVVILAHGASGQIPRVGLEERVRSLEKTVAALNYRVVKLESLSKPNLAVAGPRAVWRKLRHGMTPDQVRSLLGEPARVEANEAWTTWRYSDRNDEPYVEFKSADMRVQGWAEPE